MINTKEDKKSNGEKEYSNGNNSTSGAAARLLKLQNNLKVCETN